MLRALVLSVLCTACMVPVGRMPPSGSAPAPAPPTMARREEMARNVLVEANRARQAQGRAVLVADPRLDRAAMRYASELANLRRLSHESPVIGYETLTKRIEAEGVKWQRAGENLASTRGTTTTVPRQAIDMWLNSSGHRANLLNGEYTHSGVGVAVDLYGAWYVVQVYVKPLASR